jgi:hypothetical protein
MLRHALWLLLLACSCDGCDGDATARPPSPVAPAPEPAPDGLLADAVVRAPAALLGELRDAMGGPALLVPRTVGSLVSQLLGLPLQAAEHVDEQLPLVATSQTQGDAQRWAAAVHLRNRAAMIATLTTGADAAFDKRDEGAFVWLSAKPALRTAALAGTIAVYDHHLVLASDAAAVTALGPYLVRTVAARERRGAEIAIDVHDASFGMHAAKALSSWVERRRALPTLPAIEALLDVDAWLPDVSALLADLGAGTIAVDLSRETYALVAELKPRDEDAKTRMAARPLMESDIGALPDDAVAALSWAQRAPRATPQNGARLAALIGLPPADVTKLDDALASMARARGERTLLGLRCTGIGFTGVAHGDVAERGALRDGLAALAALGKHPAAVAKLEASSLRLQVSDTRILHVPHDVTRLRLEPLGKDRTPLDDIDLLYAITDTRFMAAAGMETVDSVQRMHAQSAEGTWRTKPTVQAALGRMPARSWLTALVDPQGIHACTQGQPSGPLATPVALSIGPKADGIELRLELARSLVRVVADQL